MTIIGASHPEQRRKCLAYANLLSRRHQPPNHLTCKQKFRLTSGMAVLFTVEDAPEINVYVHPCIACPYMPKDIWCCYIIPLLAGELIVTL